MDSTEQEFRERLVKLPREELLEIIQEQNPELIKQINRIEYVFSHKLRHLNWSDGSVIEGRDLTNEELSLLIDMPFSADPLLTRAGIHLEQQRELHIARDPVMWARSFLAMSPRVYQILMMRDPSKRKVLRAGRRLGKTTVMAFLTLHYAYTHNDGRVLVIAPMKSHVELIYQEIMRMAKAKDIVFESITRNVTSPQFFIQFSNGSTVRFFTTGMRSGGKADVARGQEAHLIILDELDYMGPDDLEAIYVMLQKTDERQEDKILIGASTPTGRREKFWEWCTRNPLFKEFYYPSYCNPSWDRAVEDEFRAEYNEMAYRHEIEADWGEDTEGVFPRRFVDIAFSSGRILVPDTLDADLIKDKSDWEYLKTPTSSRSFHVIGVDWDKTGAGTNIVVLEVCGDDYEDERAANKLRVAYREEVPKGDYTLLIAVDRIIELNRIFEPRHIYVDRGYGDTQVELLHKYGVEHPESGLSKKLRGVSFSETLEIIDPATRQPVKKDIKPFMVNNLQNMLQRELIVIPSHDEELYMQLISYVVVRISQHGRPVFEASGTQVDHALDALMLCCLAVTQHYGDFTKLNVARYATSFSSSALLPRVEAPGSARDYADEGRSEPYKRRKLTMTTVGKPARTITRKKF